MSTQFVDLTVDTSKTVTDTVVVVVIVFVVLEFTSCHCFIGYTLLFIVRCCEFDIVYIIVEQTKFNKALFAFTHLCYVRAMQTGHPFHLLDDYPVPVF